MDDAGERQSDTHPIVQQKRERLRGGSVEIFNSLIYYLRLLELGFKLEVIQPHLA